MSRGLGALLNRKHTRLRCFNRWCEIKQWRRSASITPSVGTRIDTTIPNIYSATHALVIISSAQPMPKLALNLLARVLIRQTQRFPGHTALYGYTVLLLFPSQNTSCSSLDVVCVLLDVVYHTVFIPPTPNETRIWPAIEL